VNDAHRNTAWMSGGERKATAHGFRAGQSGQEGAEPRARKGEGMRGNFFRFAGILVFLCVVGTCGGCASTQETSTLQQSMTILYDRQEKMERRLEGFDAQSHKGGDLYARIEELQVRVGRLNGRIEELEHKIEQLSRAAASPPATAASPPPDHGSAPPPVAVSPPPPPAPAPPPPVTPPPERENPEKIQYEKATRAYQSGKYEVARKEFQSFLSKYPKSELADNALFTMGECYFSEKRYQDAIEVYQQVLDQYPRGNKVPNALLKQGTAFQQLGDSTAARILYERLVEKYPGTPQAQAAEKKLKQMR